ncbi:MAG TPA: serine/threonine-protein kinase [Drouetiella sp.]|jgi:predicted Ser/Thr protein kinase
MMAKLELSIPYKTMSTTMAIVYLACWAALGLMLVGYISQAVLVVASLLNPVARVIFQILFTFASAAAFAYIPYRVVSTLMQGGCISANQNGLGLPGSFLRMPKLRPWGQLKLAEMERNIIYLTFDDNEQISINSKQLSSEQLEQFLLALEVWGHKAVLANSLIEVRDRVQNEKAGLEDHGYTKLWEEELNRRFNSTTFVPLEPGAKLRSDSFTILKQLAFGGFSAVYLAEDNNRNQVVIKESATNISDASHEKALELFKREALLLSALNHPQIAKLLDNFIEAGRNYMVLEYIQGDNLREYVRKHGVLEEALVLDLMAQMVGVLSYLHEQNPPIIHRDFTPDNLVMKADRTLVVIDFGAANEYVGTATGTLIGKQCYMPPEQVRGKCELKTDLYALGCTASFLLTGKDPEALRSSRPRTLKPNVSEQTEEIISQLTQQDPQKRTQSAQALKELLQQWNQKTKTQTH